MALLLASVLLTKTFVYGQPDLQLDEAAMRRSYYVTEETYQAGSCEINECLMHLKDGPFPVTRTLLRFDTRAANVGNEPFTLGVPSVRNPNFVWDQCHRHYHFENFAEYTVYDVRDTQEARNLVPETGKRAFCLMDTSPTGLYNGPSNLQPTRRTYTCSNQGISVGWQDIYGANLDCQFVDITDLQPGSYNLVVTLNPLFVLREVNTNNNRAVIPFRVEAPGRQQVPPNCLVPNPEWLGDGYCDTGAYNSADCAYDFGDCCEYCCRNSTFRCGGNGYTCNDMTCESLETPMEIPPLPPTFSTRATTTTQAPSRSPVRMSNPGDTTGCNAEYQEWIGDGYCDFGLYNTARCGYDGGDCCQSTCMTQFYMCGDNGYDCQDPSVAIPITI